MPSYSLLCSINVYKMEFTLIVKVNKNTVRMPLKKYGLCMSPSWKLTAHKHSGQTSAA